MSTTQPALSLVNYELAEGVATIMINRPQALNSLNPVVIHQLQQAFDRAIADRQVRGIVLGGAGKAFIVGADIEFFVRSIEAGDIPRIVKFTEAGHQLLAAVDRSPKPVVARVQGAALGGGFEVALACDRIVASPAASFGFPETGLGIYPGLGGTQRTPRMIGVGLAKWLILTGKTLSAAEAAKIGLVDQVVVPEDLDQVSRGLALGGLAGRKPAAIPPEYAAIEQCFSRSRVAELRTGGANAGDDPAVVRAMRSIVGKPAAALEMAEWLIEEGSRRSLDDGLQMELDHLTEIFSAPEAQRGLRSCARKHLG